MSTDLVSIAFPDELIEGARNAVRTCLAIEPSERVVIYTDLDSLEIGAALAAEVRGVGAPLTTCVVEDFARRPATELPDTVADAFENADVSLFTAGLHPGELKMRMAMTGIVKRRGMRHAHMVGVTNRIMTEGMRADFLKVDELTRWVMKRARQAKEITCTTPAGTDLVATFVPELKWIPTSGIISSAKWGNLPGGETFTSPARVDGVFVVDGVLGDWLAGKYGDMRATPLTIGIEDSRITSLACDNAEALEDFRTYTSTDENSNRVGEFALGTNTAIKGLIGNMLQDEKIPGVHIAFGHPYSAYTGAQWRSTTHIDVVGRDFDVWFDGEPVMAAGRYVREVAV
ncbi:MAG: aminopeptidase [Planctomycetota bacterium]|jgi:leucyl aminopeptidase (aminopeptidase T)